MPIREKSPGLFIKVTRLDGEVVKQGFVVVDDGFERFWSEYPKRVKKKEAKKAWAQLRPGADLIEKILVAVRWQRETPAWLKDEGEFIPHPATWIRGERWEDEPCDTRPVLSKRNARIAQAIANIRRTEGE